MECLGSKAGLRWYFLPCEIGMENEGVDSKPNECEYNLPKKKKKRTPAIECY